jgi:uroporphyrinogen decarboxylase
MSMKKAMTPKERVLTALASQEPDRVPVNYCGNGGIDRRLIEHFGLAPHDYEGLFQALRVDFRYIGAPYTGPKLHADIPERGVMVSDWGIHVKWVEHSTGGYWDYCDWPLSGASEEEIAAWPMPSPDDFDYSVVPELCRQHGQHALYVGGPGLGDIINGNGMLRTMEQALLDLAMDEPAGMLLARRRTDINIEITRRTLEAARGAINFLWMGEDLGTQIAPMVSLDLFRTQIRPFHQQIVDLAKSFGLPVMIHTCGSSSWAYEDFIAMGINAVDTLQPEAHNMAPEHLKKTFGGRLAFHGCISTGGPVATGTPDDVVADCRRTLEIMMPGGGYCFAPSHQLQDNSPTENVLAMYDTAMRYGAY